MEWLPIVNPFFLVFWITPPILIVRRLKRRTNIHMGVLFSGYVLLGWICVNGGIWLHYKLLGVLIDATTNPPKEWIDAWTADGAKRVFGLIFGWLYAMIYFTAWLLPLSMGAATVNWIRKTRASNKGLEGTGDPQTARPSPQP